MTLADTYWELEDLPREDTSVPEGIGEEALKALEAGEIFAARVLYAEYKPLPDTIPDEYLNLLHEVSCAKDAALQLFIAVFYIGVYQELTGRVDETRLAKRNALLALARAKRHMMQSILHMPAEVRIQLHHEHRNLDPSQKHWWHNWLAALAIARIADALMRRGCQIFLPTPEEDIFGQVDVIARLPGGHEHLCIRVRARKNETITTAPIVTEIMTRGRFSPFVASARSLEKKFGKRWIPLYIRVGYKVGPHGELTLPSPVMKQFLGQIDLIMKDFPMLYREFRKATNHLDDSLL